MVLFVLGRVVMIGLLSHAVAYFLIYFNYRSNAIDPT